MAKLVIGTDKINAVPAILKDSSPDHYIEKIVVNGQLQNSTNIINLKDVTSIGMNACSRQYANLTFDAGTNIDLSSLTSIDGLQACSYMFFNSNGFSSVDLSSLTEILGQQSCMYMFGGCINLATIDLSSLTTINGDSACQAMFETCRLITSVSFPALVSISGNSACSNMFNNGNMTTMTFPLLSSITGNSACSYMFQGCKKLTSVSFPAIKTTSFGSTINQLNNMFSSCTALTEIHFPSNVQTEVSALTGYASKFGASNATIYFDLPATE